MKKNIITILLTVLVVSLVASCTTTNLPSEEKSDIIKKFSSEEELLEFLEKGGNSGGYYSARTSVVEMAVAEDSGEAPIAAAKNTLSSDGGGADGFSKTNIQVEGVDEADIVKNDGRYIYVLTGNKIAIVDAYPADDAELISEIEIKGNAREFFINGDKLIVFSDDYKRTVPRPVLYKTAVDVDIAVSVDSGAELDLDDSGNEDESLASIIPFPDYVSQFSYAAIYDISDRMKPLEEEKIVMSGYYFDSRMIGDKVYMINNEHVWYRNNIQPPCVYTIRGDDVKERCMSAPDIYYFDYPDSYEFSTIMAISLEDNSHQEKTILKGTSQNMFVSKDNIYVTFQRRIPYYEQQWRILKEVVIPELPSEITNKIDKIQGYEISDQSKFSEIDRIIDEWSYSLSEEERQEYEEKISDDVEEARIRIQKELEKTIIQKISIDGMDINVEESGEVPGRVLNQFSMDEYGGYFRIATTNSQWNREGSANNVYVLDDDMDVVGKLEDLAPGERIYSARFMGKRLYLVTFRNIDPLFVIDLEDPEDPTVLGKLKIPGYSDYLHPYDENHIMGVGKETISDEKKDIAWQQGVKLSLFDVSDVEKPKQVAKYEIGDRGTDSYALNDHKAFLFSKDKNLLVIPVRVAEIDPEKYPGGVEDWQYGDTVFQGAYVFNLDLEDGFDLKGKVTHVEDEEKYEKSGHYWYAYGQDIKRSLYMDDVLYTISDSMIKMNDLDDIDDEINSVSLPYDNPYDDEPLFYAETVASREILE